MKLPSSSVFRLRSSSKMELLKVSPNLCFLEMVNDFLCWCLLQASFCKHFDLPTFLIQKYLTFFVLVPSTGKLLHAFWFVNLSHAEICDVCVGAFYRQAFASIHIIDAQLLLGKEWCSTTCPKLQSNCVQDYHCHLLWTILPMCLPWFRPCKPMCLLVESPFHTNAAANVAWA